MKRFNTIKSIRFDGYKGLLFTLALFFVFGTAAHAEEEPVNSTMKAVLADVKSELNSNELLTTILMILGVIMVVGVAMWLSFRTPDKSLK